MNPNQTKSSGRMFDVLYRTKQYGKWKGAKVSIPLDLDPEHDRLEYAKKQLDEKKIDYAVGQVKFGALETRKSS